MTHHVDAVAAQQTFEQGSSRATDTTSTCPAHQSKKLVLCGLDCEVEVIRKFNYRRPCNGRLGWEAVDYETLSLPTITRK